MSFTANDSRRGDQLPALQRLTHVPAIPGRIDSTGKKKKIRKYSKYNQLRNLMPGEKKTHPNALTQQNIIGLRTV